jgi:two-component system alkaline phosphatase synthesis response regulator PhoP
MITEYPILKSNGITVNKNKYTITVNDKEHYTSKLIFDLLHYLMSNDHRIITRDELLNNVWCNDFIGVRTIDVHVKKLRLIIGNDKIMTIKKVGYIWKSN